MKKLILSALAGLLSFGSLAQNVPPTFIEELDGSPSSIIGKLKVPNGSLTDNGDGTFTLSITGGGGTHPVDISTDIVGQLPLANGGTGANLSDPGADRIMFWDDGAGAVTFLSAGTGLQITGTTLEVDGTGLSNPYEGIVTITNNITDASTEALGNLYLVSTNFAFGYQTNWIQPAPSQLVIAGSDAIITLVGTDEGSHPVTIDLAEMDDSDGSLRNKWSITREDQGAGSSLEFIYGTDSDHSVNQNSGTDKIQFETDGGIEMRGTAPESRWFDNDSTIGSRMWALRPITDAMILAGYTDAYGSEQAYIYIDRTAGSTGLDGIGINTTAPDTSLHLKAFTSGNDFIIENDSSGDFWGINAGLDMIIGNGTTAPTSTERMRFKQDGRVGVGFNPTSGGQLHVVQNGETDRLVVIGGTVQSGNRGLQIEYRNADDYGRIQAVHQGTGFKDLRIQTSGGSTYIGTAGANMSFKGPLFLDNGPTTSGQLNLYEDSDDGGQYVSVRAAAMGSNWTLTLPADDGTANQVLQTDGAGVTSWATVSGSGAFSDASDPVVLNTTTKDVAIGSALINSAKLSVDGDADQVQFAIQGHSTQTSNLMEMENSAGTVVWSVDVNGDMTLNDLTVSGNFSAGSLTFADAATAPASVGEFLYNNTVTGLDDGAMQWYDDDEVRTVVDLDSSEALASGDDGKALRYNWNGGNGFFDLVTIGGGGNVSNTGTPVNNQVAVWTAATTVEGDADFTFDGTSLTIGQASSTDPHLLTLYDGGADNEPGRLVMAGDNGNLYSLFVSTAGNLRFHTSGTITDDDTDGDVVMLRDVSETLAGNKTFSAETTFNEIIQLYDTANPTTDTAGDVAFDTDAWAGSRGAIEVYDGTASTFVVSVLASDTPTNGQVPKWNTGGTITWEDDTGGASGGLTLTDGNGVDAEGAANAIANNSYQGFKVITGRNAGETLTQWDVVYLNPADGEWHQADADESVDAGKAWGIAAAAATDGNPVDVIVSGIIRNDTWAWTGDHETLYVSDTAGAMTETAPSTTGDVVKAIGITLSDDEVFVNFSQHWLEVGAGGGTLGSNLSSTTDDITSDNGTILFAGSGGTNNEDLDWDFETSANQVGVSSSTGVTTVEFGTIAVNQNGGDLGAATATTAAAGDNDTSVATTAFVRGETQRQIYISAGAMIPNTTSGGEASTTELATNDIMYDSVNFDSDADEFAGAWVTLPDNFVAASNIAYEFHWTAASGSGNVYWTAGARVFDDSDAMDTAVTLATAASDTLLTANDMHIGSSITGQTIEGTDNPGDVMYIRISRDADNASDTLGVDAQLLGVTITW